MQNKRIKSAQSNNNSNNSALQSAATLEQRASLEGEQIPYSFQQRRSEYVQAEEKQSKEPNLVQLSNLPSGVLGYFNPVSGEVVVGHRFHQGEPGTYATQVHEYEFHHKSGGVNEDNADAYTFARTGDVDYLKMRLGLAKLPPWYLN